MLYLHSFNRFILISLALLGLSVSSVNAAVVSADDAIFGAGSVTRDTISGLDWLDLTLSTNRSYTDVSGQFGVGGDFEGWGYATTSDVADLYTSAGGTGPYNGSPGSDIVWIADLLVLWGITSSSALYQLSYAITSTVLSEPLHYMTYLYDDSSPSGDDFALTESFTIFVGGSSFDKGSALIRTSVVPVPAAVWLFGTALIGLAGFGKRKFRIAA
jgi:hypothetical protein